MTDAIFKKDMSIEQPGKINATGAMAGRVRAFDWGATALGAIETWPERLCGAVEAMLAAPQLASLAVGAERIFFYNDEAARHYGNRHPAVLGEPLARAFADEFAQVASFYNRVFDGESVHVPHQPLDPAKRGTPELFDAWLTPVRGADGAVIAAAMTGFAIGERRRKEAERRAGEERRRAGLERRIDTATDELRASRELLQGTIDSSDDMIQVFGAIRDEAGEIVDFRWLLNNRTSEERYGAVAGASLLERNPGVVAEGIFDAFKRVTETGVPEKAEHHYVHEQFDGWFYQSVVKLGDGVATTTKAIDDWKAAQGDILRLHQTAADAKLSETEQRFRILADTAPAMIWHNDPDGENLFVNRYFLDYTGRPRGETAGPLWQALLHPEQADACIASYMVAVRDRDTWRSRHLVRRHDDSWRWFDNVAQPLFSHDGRYLGHVGVSTDIDDTVEAERALRESLSLQSAMLEVLPLGLATVRTDGSVALSNQNWARFLPNGRIPSRDDDRGWRWRAWDEEGIPVQRENFPAVRALRGEQVLPGMEFLYTDDTGTERWTRIAAVPLRDEKHDVTGAVCIVRDIDTAKRAAEALRSSEKRQAFLLKLSDALRPLADTVEIQRTAMGALAGHFGVDSAVYHELGPDEDSVVTPEGHTNARIALPPAWRLRDLGSDFHDDLNAGRTFHYEDIETDPRLEPDRAAYRAIGIRSGIGIPLMKGGRLAAALSINHSTPRHWTGAELRLAEGVGERTSAAVERARVAAALRESEADLAYELANTTQLQEVSGLLIAGEDNEALYGRILDAAQAIMRADFASIQVVDPDSNELRLLGHRNFHPDSATYWERITATASTSCGAAFDRGGRVIWRASSTENPEELKHYRLCGIESMQSTPLTSRDGKLLGILSTHWRNAVTPAAADFRSFDILVRQTADAFERSLAETALRRNEAWLAAQNEALQAAIDGEQLEYSLDILSRAVSDQLGGGAFCAFYMLDPKIDRLRHMVGMPEAYGSRVDECSIGPDAFGCGLALFTGAPVVTPDVREEPRWRDWLPVAEEYGFRAAWSFPLETAAGEAVGTLAVHSATPRAPQPDELEIVTRVTRTAAIIISRHQEATERVRVEGALRDSEERLRQFGEASQDVLWIRDAETLQWTYLTPAFEAIYGLDRDDALSGNSYRNWLDLIVPEDRDYAVENIDRVRAGEPVAFEFRIRRPVDGGIRWMRNTDFPIADDDGKVVLIGGIGSDITGLREAEQRLHMLIAGIPQLVWRACDDGRWTWASPQWTSFTGQAERDSHGFGWLDPVHPDDRERVKGIWAGAVERGEFHADYRLCHGRERRYRWFQTRATPVREADGEIVEWFGTSTDVDERRQLQDRQQLLLAELQHRVRNMLTVVRSVFSRTIEVDAPIEELADHFKGRLDSLARTQVVVTQSATGLVDLENLIRDELMSVGASDGPRLVIAGPDVALEAKAAESIGLAIHELTTNALKYGALKISSGRLEIRWTTNVDYGPGRRLDLTWNEQGVPAVPLTPARHGFGTELITEALPYRLGAETSLQFRGGGVFCTISVPLPDEGALTASVWKEA